MENSNSKKNRLDGIDDVMKSLNEEMGKIKGKTLKGLILASIVVMRDMEKTSPKIPVDIGNLRASRFTVTSKGEQSTPGINATFKGEDSSRMEADHTRVVSQYQSEAASEKNPTLILGFSANYATFVHENMEAKFQRSGSGPKFFEKALSRNKGKILEIIANNAKI